MKWFNSDSKLIFNVILALILGIVFGNFLGNSMIKNDTIYANANNYSDEVYILQVGLFYDEANATFSLAELKAIGLDGLIVKEKDKFYVYLGISCDSDEFASQLTILENHEIDYLIKIKKLYYFLNTIDSNDANYDFYYQSINFYLSMLHNKTVTIPTDYTNDVSVSTMELYNQVNALNENIHEDVAPMYKLYVYQVLADLLI